MTMSVVQALVPVSDPVEVRTSSEPGFPAALKDASHEHVKKARDADETSVAHSRSHPSRGNERSEVRGRSRGPEHATGLERAAEMVSKELPVGHHNPAEQTQLEEFHQAASEALVDLLDTVDAPVEEIEIDDSVSSTGEVSLAPAEFLVALEEAKLVPMNTDPDLEEATNNSQMVSLFEAVKAVRPEPGAEAALLAVVDDGPKVTLLESELEIAGGESQAPAAGLSKEAEVDLEVLSQFLGTVPQSLDVKTEPLEVLMGDSGSPIESESQAAEVQQQAGVVQPQAVPLQPQVEVVLPLGSETAALAEPVIQSAAQSTQEVLPIPNVASQSASDAKVTGIDNAIEHFVASSAQPAVQATESKSPVVGVGNSNPQSEIPEAVSTVLPSQASKAGQEHTSRGSSDSSSSNLTQEVSAPKEATPPIASTSLPNGAIGESSRGEMGEPLSRAMVRLVERIEVLRNAPPPRTMILELAELAGARVRVSLEGDSVRMTVLDGSMDPESRERLDRELGQALSERGFDLAGENTQQDEREEEADDQVTFSAPQNQRSVNRAASELRI